MTDIVLFASRNAHGYSDLWVTNGTAAGTSELSIAGAWSEGLNPSEFTIVGSELLFAGWDANANVQLWISNGTAGGTSELSVAGASNYGDDSGLIPLGDEILFNAYDANALIGLWVTNGTTAGTSELSNSVAVANNSFSSDIQILDDKLLFVGGDLNLYVTDGTTAGTSELTITASDSSGLFSLQFPIQNNIELAPNFTVFGNEALFVGADANDNLNLYVTNGTAAGTSELSISTAYSSGLFRNGYYWNGGYDNPETPPDFTVFASEVLFEGWDANGNLNLWVTDGTAAGTSELPVVASYSHGLFFDESDSHFPVIFANFIVLSNEVLFTGADVNGKIGLWVTDGTTGGTSELSIPGTSSNGLNPSAFCIFGSEVLFNGTDASGNVGLWVTNGSQSGTVEIYASGPLLGSAYTDFTVFGSEAVFTSENNLWVTNGTVGGTSEISVAQANSLGLFSDILEPDFTVVGTDVLFDGRDASGVTNLWVTNGTAAGTSEISITGVSSLDPSDLTAFSEPGPYSVSPSLATADEDQGTLDITITRLDASQSQTVYVSTVQNQGYYNAASGTTSTSYYYGGLVNVPYTFEAGQTSIEVPISIYDHGLPSGSEEFGFEVQDGSGNELASNTFTIDNTDTSSETYSVSPGPAAVNEDFPTLKFIVTRSDDSEQETVTVSTAQDQGYYNALTGTTSTNYYYDALGANGTAFTFAVGQSSISVPITINDNGLIQGSEKFGFEVQNASGANVASTTFTILNSDPAPANPQPPPTNDVTTPGGPTSLSEVVSTWRVDFGAMISDSDIGVSSYQFSNLSGSGFFTVDGVRQNSTVTVSPSQLSTLGFNVGDTVGTDQIQVQGIDDGTKSAPLNVTVDVTSANSPAAAPSAVTLADLSNDIYYNLTKAPGFALVPFDIQGDAFDNIGYFEAAAYANSNDSQIVIAFRGTDPADIENLIADSSFVGFPAGEMDSYFEYAANLLEDISTLYPNAEITLTGHSLGGAIAQLLGEASNLPVTAFDAPGGQQLYPGLLSFLDGDDPTASRFLTSERNQQSSQAADTNFRMFGDLVSSVGVPITGSIITTLPWLNNPLDLNFLDRHQLGPLQTEVQDNVAPVPQLVDELLEPQLLGAESTPEALVYSVSLSALTQYFVGLGIGQDNGTQTSEDTIANTSNQYVSDQSGNSDFLFTEDHNSPSISSIELPILPGVQSYEVRYETGSSWSTFQQVWPEQWLAPGSEVDGVEFIPVDSSGHAASVTDSVMFGLVFSASGALNGTLTSSALNPPSLINDGSIAVAAGATATISESLLQFDDNVSTHDQETYTITTAPAHGTLLDVGLPANSFTQADIDNGRISYSENDNKASSDSFAFDVADSFGEQTSPQQFTIQISSPPSPPPPTAPGTTAAMIMRAGGNGNYEIYDLGNNGILAATALGQVGLEWQVAGLGGFNGASTSDMILRDSNNGALEVYDISDNAITFATGMGQVGLEWQVSGFGDFSSRVSETDMLMRNSNTGQFEIYDISNNAITSAAPMGQVGNEWKVAGFGDFSTRANESDMLMRNSNTGQFEIYDISNNAITSAAPMGQVGLEWSVAGFGDFSGNANETDMLMRNNNTGAFEIYDIRNSALASAAPMGQVGLEWTVVGFGPIDGAGTSDMLMRNSNTGAFELYDITNNQLTNAAPMGQVGLEWQVAGIAADPPTSSAAQMAQAMASYTPTSPPLADTAASPATGPQPAITAQLLAPAQPLPA